MPEPTTQKSQVMKVHIACEPTDDTGCLDHVGCTKSKVYAPAVSVVHEAANLSFNGTKIRLKRRNFRIKMKIGAYKRKRTPFLVRILG